MTTVMIVPVSNANGEKTYRAVAGNKQSIGSTMGQALDALTAQLDETELSPLLLIQSFRPDQFFTAEQQQRLAELMNLWRSARDQGQDFPFAQQAELDSLVEAELKAAAFRTASIAQQLE